MTRKLMPLFALLLVTACKKNPPVVAGEVEASPVQPTVATARIPEDLSEAMATMGENFRRISFGYDSEQLEDTAKQYLDHNAAIMQRHARIEVEVQGHADERGTVEYNLALGQKRAESVRKYMGALGVEGSRIRTVTYGEEAPLDTESTEVAWAENRRAEFRVLKGQAPVIKGTVE